MVTKPRKFIGLLLLAGVLILTSCGNLTRQDQELLSTSYDPVWRFQAGEGVDSNWFAPDYDDSHWVSVVSNKTLVDQKVDLKDGFGWYRRSILFPKETWESIEKAEGIVLNLGKFAACEEVYLNGKLIGKTGQFPHDYAGYFDHHRTYYVPAEKVALQGENLIAIKFHDGWSGSGGFIDGAALTIQPATVQDKLVLDVDVMDDDYVFLGEHGIAIQPYVENKSHSSVVKGLLSIKLLTDDFRFVQEEQFEATIGPKSTYRFNAVGLSSPDPGFYRYDISFKLDDTLSLNKKVNVGYEPEKIISAPDRQADFGEFWENNLEELKRIDPDYKLTILPEQSQLDYEMYLVTMRSFEHELIQGYYARPKRPGKHPVIVEYMGYGSSPYFPNQTWDGFAYFVLSVRGQALNKPTNRFGTWFTYGIDNKEDYYYRGAFLDVIRALDFVSSRAEIDADRIAVRGGSQGGALSAVAAALDRRVKVAAISIPFLSDYRDYFRICSWPRSDVELYMEQHPQVSWDQIYQTLSYFDIKNLASWIDIPVIMGVGVQDEVCPPHINFAAYNEIKGRKSWMAFGRHGHSTGKEFHQAGMDLFKEILKAK